MSSPEGIILEQFYDELKDRGIKIGNKVKLRNGTTDIIIDTDNRKYGSSYPIVLSSGSSHTLDGIYILKSESDYDVVDWNYKEPEDITPNHPDVSYWDNGEVIEVNNESAIGQLERYKKYQVHWCQQNVSNTISYSVDEVPQIINWFMENWEIYVGVSFLFRADPTKTAKDLGYMYLPQEVTTEAKYNEYVAKLKPVNFDKLSDSMENEMDSQECSGGACPVK